MVVCVVIELKIIFFVVEGEWGGGGGGGNPVWWAGEPLLSAGESIVSETAPHPADLRFGFRCNVYIRAEHLFGP